MQCDQSLHFQPLLIISCAQLMPIFMKSDTVGDLAVLSLHRGIASHIYRNKCLLFPGSMEPVYQWRDEFSATLVVPSFDVLLSYKRFNSYMQV